jgi:hypothetical protein
MYSPAGNSLSILSQGYASVIVPYTNYNIMFVGLVRYWGRAQEFMQPLEIIYKPEG